MVCQKCQVSEATTHTTVIVNGDLTESHLCAKCSGDMGQIPTQELLQQMFGGLGTLFNLPNMPILKSQAKEVLSQTCPHCGITLADIQKTGKLGCPHDYKVFGKALSQVVSMSQAGAQRHIGKMPSNASADTRRGVMQSRMDDLQKKLENAVFREDYERAAKYRDEIKAAKSKLG